MTEQEKREIFAKIEEAYNYIAKAMKILEELGLKIAE